MPGYPTFLDGSHSVVAGNQELAAQHQSEVGRELPAAQLGLAQRDRVLVLVVCADVGNLRYLLLFSRSLRSTYSPNRRRIIFPPAYATASGQVRLVHGGRWDNRRARARRLGSHRRFHVVEPGVAQEISPAVRAGGGRGCLQ